MNPLIQQELRKADAQARAAALKVSTASSLREVEELSRLSLPPLVRGMRQAVPGIRALHQAAVSQARRLVDGQLQELAGLAQAGDRRQFQQRYQDLQRNHWHHLRGEFADILRTAMAQAQRLKAGLDRQATNA